MRTLFTCAFLCASVLAAKFASAEVASAYAYSMAFSAEMYTDAGPYAADSGLLNGFAPGPFNNTVNGQPLVFGNSLFSFSGTASQQVVSTVDGTSGSKATAAQATLRGIDFQIGEFLSFTADTATAYADVVGESYPFEFSSSTVGGSLTVLGQNVILSPGIVYSQDGLHITYSGGGSSFDPTLTTQSYGSILSVEMLGFVHGEQVYTGIIRIGNVGAMQTAVPEPATLLVLGAAGALVWLRRRAMR